MRRLGFSYKVTLKSSSKWLFRAKTSTHLLVQIITALTDALLICPAKDGQNPLVLSAEEAEELTLC